MVFRSAEHLQYIPTSLLQARKIALKTGREILAILKDEYLGDESHIKKVTQIEHFLTQRGFERAREGKIAPGTSTKELFPMYFDEEHIERKGSLYIDLTTRKRGFDRSLFELASQGKLKNNYGITESSLSYGSVPSYALYEHEQQTALKSIKYIDRYLFEILGLNSSDISPESYKNMLQGSFLVGGVHDTIEDHKDSLEGIQKKLKKHGIQRIYQAKIGNILTETDILPLISTINESCLPNKELQKLRHYNETLAPEGGLFKKILLPSNKQSDDDHKESDFNRTVGNMKMFFPDHLLTHIDRSKKEPVAGRNRFIKNYKEKLIKSSEITRSNVYPGGIK